jgi:hypothetical protein
MGKKKNPTTTTPTGLPALKIGSRVRCTDDGVTGRIVWANAVAVKVKWDDGEQVTWKRDSLATRPIEILDAEGEAEPQAPEAPEPGEQAPPEQEAVAPQAEPTAEQAIPLAAPEVTAATEATTADQTMPPSVEPTPADAGTSHPTTTWEDDLQAARPEAPADQGEDTPASTPAQPKRQRKPKAPAEPKEKKVSALDAAARVLAEAGQAMTTKEMIGVMAAKGYWSSPGGQTPDATLYSAILREIATKGDRARFVKAAPGRFTRRPTA